MPKPTDSGDWTTGERRLLNRLTSPGKIQAFLDSLPYNKEPKGPTCRSPRAVLRDGTAHCMEGAVVAAAALEFHGHHPYLLDLEAVRDVDHVLALYRIDGHWGAIAKSNYPSLRFREAVYRSIRELAMSYFEHYHNTRGEKTLRAYSRPISLTRFRGWQTGPDTWGIAEHLVQVPHTKVLTKAMEDRLSRLDDRLRLAERTGQA